VSKPLLRLLSAGSLESKTYLEKYNRIGLLHMATNPLQDVGTYILEISWMWTHSLHKVCKQTSL